MRSDPNLERMTRENRIRIEEERKRADRAASEDVIIDGGRRVLLRSANGKYWRLNVSDLGVLSTTDMGTTL
jgi:hypothetical protein